MIITYATELRAGHNTLNLKRPCSRSKPYARTTDKKFWVTSLSNYYMAHLSNAFSANIIFSFSGLEGAGVAVAEIR